MTEIIKKYDTGFTQIPNEILTDNKVSARAKGVYAYLFSKPDGWSFHVEVMQNELMESKGQIYSAIKELIESGYVKRYQQNEKGKFGGVVYEFTVCGKNRIRSNRDTENRVAENRITENPNTNNTYISNTYSSNTDSSKNVFKHSLSLLDSSNRVLSNNNSTKYVKEKEEEKESLNDISGLYKTSSESLKQLDEVINQTYANNPDREKTPYEEKLTAQEKKDYIHDMLFPPKKYKYEGEVIKLDDFLYSEWEKAFPKLDLKAVLDDYDKKFALMEGETRNDWYKILSVKLLLKNEEM